MSDIRMPFALLLSVATAGAIFTTMSPAQVPEGSAVVGTAGAAAGSTQGAVELFILYLNGTAVDPARTQRILLGNAANAGGAWNAVLPDDRILVLAAQQSGPLASGPMATSPLAIVDTSVAPPTITPLPTPAVSTGAGGGIAVDPTGRFAYVPLTVNINSPSRTAYLHRLELATNQVCQIASWPGQVAFGLTCDDDDTVYVSSSDPMTFKHYVHAVHPDGCNPATVTSTESTRPMLASGLDLDRASGRYAAASSDRPGWPSGPQRNALSLIVPTTGTATVVASAPAGGWGMLARQPVAVNNAIESYGARSDGQNRYWCENFPNPGGQPTIGNSGFSLTLASSPNGAAQSVLALSLGRDSIPFAGIEILVDLATMVPLSVPSGPSVTFALPIPGDPSLAGRTITAQSIHMEASASLAASRGLTLTLQ